MKKLIVLTLFGLLIMAFSATVYAQKLEFKASGMIDMDTTLNMNVPFYFGEVGTVHALHTGIMQTWITPSFQGGATAISGKPTNNLNHIASYTTGRGILKFDAIMGPNLSGTIFFEMDAFRYGGGFGGTGATRSGSIGGTGAPGGGLTIASDRNNMGVWSTDRASVEVKNVYIDVGLPYFGIPVPMTLRVGMQPFGVRPQILVYTDGAGITGGIKIDPVTIIPMWAKIDEGGDAAADDCDLYGLHVNAKIGTFTVGGYGLYYNMNTYPLAYPTGVAWNSTGVSAPGPGSDTTTFTTSASYGLYAAGTMKAAMWWWGVYADGKAGPVNLNFDFVYDWGKVQQKFYNNGISVPDVKYAGWAGRLKVDFPWEKFNFGMTGMYASGADVRRTGAGGIPGTTVADPAYAALGGTKSLSRKVSSYVVPPGAESAPGSQESMVMYSCFNAAADGGTGIANNGSYYQMSRGGFGGTWFAKLYASMKIAPPLKITLQGLYIGDTTQNGNTFGTARKFPFTATSPMRNDSTIGWEGDIIAELDIYKNLKFFAGFGYLWAGDAMEVYKGHGLPAAAVTPALQSNFNPKNPWNLSTRLLYTF
jgi:hypothetical protein